MVLVIKLVVPLLHPLAISVAVLYLLKLIDWQDDLQGRMSTGSPTAHTPPPGISSKLDRSPSVTPPEAWGGEPLERGGSRQTTMSRFFFTLKSTAYLYALVQVRCSQF